MSKGPALSQKEGHFDVRAPLATFDTIDLGGEDSCIAVLCKDTKRFAQQFVLTEERHDDNFSNFGQADECDGFPGLSNVKKLKNPKLQSVSSSAAYHKLEDDSDQIKAVKSSEDFTKSEELGKSVESVEAKVSSDSFSDTCSSDSESGYIQGGFVTVSDGKVICQEFQSPSHGPFTSPIIRRHSRASELDTSHENTPVSSPKLSRSQLPVLIKELENIKSESKRKALEKRIQRLQVTTNPVVRPRSTTPINVFSLEEYRDISEHDKNVTDHHEKLKIKLPTEDVCLRQKSPRRSRRSLSNAEHCSFDFNEEFLFTHTIPALVVQTDGSLGSSPKRILIPPCLSPASSPVKQTNRPSGSPAHIKKLYYLPQPRNVPLVDPSGVWNESQDQADGNSEGWAHFDEANFKKQSDNLDSQNVKASALNDTADVLDGSHLIASNENQSDICDSSQLCCQGQLPGISGVGENKSTASEDLLTVNVCELNDGVRVCDVNLTSVNIPQTNTSIDNDKLSGKYSHEESTQEQRNLNIANRDICNQIIPVGSELENIDASEVAKIDDSDKKCYGYNANTDVVNEGNGCDKINTQNGSNKPVEAVLQENIDICDELFVKEDICMNVNKFEQEHIANSLNTDELSASLDHNSIDVNMTPLQIVENSDTDHRHIDVSNVIQMPNTDGDLCIHENTTSESTA